MPDLLCLAFIALVLLFDHFVVWPSFLRRLGTDPRRARPWLYSVLVAELWTQAAAVLALWSCAGRPWSSLRWIEPRGWRLWAAIALVVALGIALALPIVKVARLKPGRRVKLPGHAERLGPHTRAELYGWTAVSLTAGFCEELVFRGYLIWVFQPLLGLWGAAALSLVVFAAAHAYQGARGILAVAMVGGAFTLVVLTLDSLWPAIALHVLVDLEQGLVLWLALRARRGGETPAGSHPSTA